MTELKTNTSNRIKTAEILVKLGYNNKEITQILLEALHDEDNLIRYSASVGLLSIGYYDDKSIEELSSVYGYWKDISIIKDRWSLGNNQQKAMLRRLVKGEYDFNRWEAGNELVKHGLIEKNIASEIYYEVLNQKYDSAWSNTSNHKLPSKAEIDNILYERQYNASLKIANLGIRDKIVAKLLENSLEDAKTQYIQQEYFTIQSALALGNIDWASEKVINALLKIVKTGNSNREDAIKYLGRLAIENKEATKALILCLNDPDPKIRRTSLLELGKLEYSSGELISRLKVMLSESKVDIRLNATLIIAKLGYTNKEILKTLIFLLSNSNDNIRTESAVLLTKYGKKDSTIITMLDSATQNQDSLVALMASTVLLELDHNIHKNRKYIFNAVRNSTPEIRRIAIKKMAKYGSEKELYEIYLSLLKDNDVEVANSATINLIKLFENRSNRELTSLLESSRSVERKIAGIILAMRQWDDSTIELIKKMTTDNRPWVRLGSSETLNKINDIGMWRDDAKQLMGKADSQLIKGQHLIAISTYTKGIKSILEIGKSNGAISKSDSGDIGKAEYQKMICFLHLQNNIDAQLSLVKAFSYDPTLHERVLFEIKNKQKRWKSIINNWYFNRLIYKTKEN